jgi:hypothetical protein
MPNFKHEVTKTNLFANLSTCRWIQKAIEADQRNRMMFHLGKDYALHGELFKRKGDKLKVQENLGKAMEIFKECGADGWVTKAEKDLATIS